MSPFLPERTSWSRVLGAELREARVRAGFKNADLAEKLAWSPAKVSRMETGIRCGSTLDLLSFATACGIFGKELKRLMELGARPWDGYWIQPNGEPMPDELRALIYLESTALALDSYEVNVIPGLLQTESYIRALFREGGVAEDRIEPRVRARLMRQALLERWEPPQFTYFIHESALRIMVGGPRVMGGQLRHLQRLSERGTCRIRIVPAAVGARSAAVYGSFLRLTHEDSATVYVEHLTTSVFLDSPIDLDMYGQVWSALEGCALTEQQSLGMLSTLESRYEPRR